MKKTLLRIIPLIFCLVLVLSIGVFAEGTYIFDGAGLFSAEELTELESQTQGYSEQAGYPIYVLTTADAEGKSTKEYAQDYYLANSLGIDPDQSGALLCIDMDNRELYIITSGTMIDILIDSRIRELDDAAFNHLVDGDYYEAASGFIETVSAWAAQGIPEGSYRQDEDGNRLTEPYEGETGVNWGMVALWGVVSLGIGGGAAALVAHNYTRDPSEDYYPFREKGRLAMKQEQDTLINKFVTTRVIPKQNNNSGGGGGSTISRSGGHSFGGGGGGRKF